MKPACVSLGDYACTHSKSPKRNRIATRVAKFLTNPVQIIMTPHMNISPPRYRDGLLRRFKIMLLGTSGKTLATSLAAEWD